MLYKVILHTKFEENFFDFFFTLKTSTANTSYGHSLTLNSPRQLHGNLKILNSPTSAREPEPLILAGISSPLITDLNSRHWSMNWTC